MTEETITFEIIREIQRSERSSPKLTKLPENFYEAARNYLEKKKSMMKDRKDELEFRNAQRLLEEIFTIREKKILNFALTYIITNLPPENLTEEEKEFFEKVVSLVKKRREEFFEKLKPPPKEVEKEIEERKEIEGEEKVEKRIGEGYVKIKFKEDIPQFVGIDEKTYGPFSPGDIAILPKENAELFINAEMAEIAS
ncbi:MAG: DNA replication complex GINS family protein [Candidatus Aenigmarchaeota archaeon]|nr:DNA replication complex GINS family protein [Candidatus Aenigmarchaeota archaeon]